jgi:RHS repeat-associated protein
VRSLGIVATLDANGNTLSDAQDRSFTWDFENRLTQVVVPGTNGGKTTFKYDPFGRRIQKSGPLGTTNYLYDGADLVEEVDGGGAVPARYTRSQNIDEPLAEIRSGTTSYYQADGLGSVTSLTSSSATIAATYAYDAFGNLLSSTGSITNPFRYTGRESDSDTGFYDYRARYYDSVIGRFVSEDPVTFVAGVNFYVYAVNDPQNLVDPTGFKACCAKNEENKIRELLASAREYLADMQAGRPYVPKHGQELAHTTCLEFRAPSGRPSKDPLGSGTITVNINRQKEPCVYECIFEHELVHKKQCESLGTKYAGLTVQQKEKPAFQREIECYLRTLRSGGLGVSSH